jgi:hypothetical protein
MEIILNKLNDLENRLQELKSVNYQQGKNEYRSITQLLERIIDRIYPEKDAKQIKSKMQYVRDWVLLEKNDRKEQEDYTNNIDLAIRVIGTIKGEYELFGFDDFKPLKEKVETEWQIGSEKIGGFFKKKKSK